MWKYDFWSSLLLLLLGIVVCYESLPLGLGTGKVPGPGFLPFGAGFLLCLLSASILTLAYITKKKAPVPTEKFWLRPDSPKIVIIILASLIVFNLTWTKLGFTVTTLLFMGFLLRIIGKRRWWVVLTGMGFTSAVAYFLFQQLLKCQLPKGILGF
jgi:putative tricarboxylic transport membrane protein